jgi:hypothetical protein
LRPTTSASVAIFSSHANRLRLARLAGRPAPVVAALRTFLGGWLGIGRIIVGMARQGYDLQVTRYGEEGWVV